MVFSEKLQILRKNKGYTQEALADKLGVSRQAVAKWESGQIYPDIFNLIQISDLMSVSVDYLVKDQDCAVNIKPLSDTNLDELIALDWKQTSIHMLRLRMRLMPQGLHLTILDMRKAIISITTHMLAERSSPEKKLCGKKDRPFTQ